MVLVKRSIVITLHITMRHDIIDEVCTSVLCYFEDADSNQAAS